MLCAECVGDRAADVGDAMPYALALRAACSRRYSSTTSSARDLPRAMRRWRRSSSSSSLRSSAIMSARVLWSTARRICDARSCSDASLSRLRRVSSRDQSSRRRTSLASAIAAAPSAPAPPSTPRTSSSMALRKASAALDALDACANCLRHGDRELRPVALEFRVVARGRRTRSWPPARVPRRWSGSPLARRGRWLGDVGLGVAPAPCSPASSPGAAGWSATPDGSDRGGLPGEHAVNLGAHGAARNRDSRWTRRVAWKETRARSSGRVVRGAVCCPRNGRAADQLARLFPPKIHLPEGPLPAASGCR